MVATRTEGRTYFEDHDPDVLVRLTNALSDFRERMGKPEPTLLTLNRHNEHRQQDIEDWLAAQGLKVKLAFSNLVLAEHHVWFGRPKAGMQRSPVRTVPSVRVVASRPAVPALMPPMQQVVIAVPVPEVEELHEERLIITPGEDDMIRGFIRLSRPALPAPKIAGLLLAVNPRGDEVGSIDAGEDEGEAELPPMVLNREWIDAWRTVHLPTQENARAGISKANAEHNAAILRSFNSDAAKSSAPIVPFVAAERPEPPTKSDTAVSAASEHKTSEEAAPIKDAAVVPVVNLEHKNPVSGGTEAVSDGPMCGPELPPTPAVLPQEVTMHPREPMKELAEAKSQPGALGAPLCPRCGKPTDAVHEKYLCASPSVPARNPLSLEARLERKAMESASVQGDRVDDFLEAMEHAIQHRDNAEAQLLPDGHRFAKHGKQGQIKVCHPQLRGVVDAMVVAVQLHKSADFRFVARRHDVRAYLEKCAAGFAKKGITPISAGEMYPDEGEVAA